MFYDRYAELCRENGLSPSAAAREMNIGASSVTDWKKRGVLPSGRTLRKIAEYFGVSVNELLGIEKDPADVDGVNSEIEQIFNALTPDHQQQALAFLRFLTDTETQEK